MGKPPRWRCQAMNGAITSVSPPCARMHVSDIKLAVRRLRLSTPLTRHFCSVTAWSRGRSARRRSESLQNRRSINPCCCSSSTVAQRTLADTDLSEDEGKRLLAPARVQTRKEDDLKVEGIYLMCRLYSLVSPLFLISLRQKPVIYRKSGSLSGCYLQF